MKTSLKMKFDSSSESKAKYITMVMQVVRYILMVIFKEIITILDLVGDIIIMEDTR